MPYNRAPEPMDDREFLGVLKKEYEGADSFVNGSTLAEQRANGMMYYLGMPLGNEIKGRSQVVSRDVFETVEWIMPQLMEMLISDTAVEFEPEGQEDIDAADQATAWVNYQFMRKNPGFLILYDWIKDGLISKKGYVKSYWDRTYAPELETYQNIDEAELALLIMPDEVEVRELTQTGQKDLGDGNKVNLYDLKVFRYKDIGCLKIENPAPEDVLVRPGTVSLVHTDYVSEVFEATRSDLLNMGFPEELVDQCHFGADIPGGYENVVKAARSRVDDAENRPSMAISHSSMRKGRFVEAYIRVDRDGDGYTELLQVIHDERASVILSVTEVDAHPYNDLDIIRIPHRHFGLSAGDIMKDLQEIKTMLTRGMLDKTYFSLNGRWAVLDEQVNLSDLTNPIPGGIVRERMPNAIRALETPGTDGSEFALMEYVDRVRERRAGVNEVQYGVDKSALGSNVAAGALDRAMKAAQARILLLARMIAETGIKPLMLRIYELGRKNQFKEEVIRLRGTFIPVKPTDWKDRADMSVTVGVGNTSPQEKLTQLGIIRDTMLMAMQAGTGIVVPKNAYNLAIEMVKATQRHDYSRFFTDPDDPNAPKPPPPQPSFEEQVKLREVAVKEKKQALEEKQFEWQQIVDAAEVQLEDRQNRAVGLQTGK